MGKTADVHFSPSAASAAKESGSIFRKSNTTCFHCGDSCVTSVEYNKKKFCCKGCVTVYKLLEENGLCGYYDFENSPGIKVKGKFNDGRFGFLDDASLVAKLTRFSSSKLVHVNFHLPQIHCSSCLYLLENLPKLAPGIIQSTVHFQRREIYIRYDPAVQSLRKVVELLAFIGYEPSLSLKDSITGQASTQVSGSGNKLRKEKLIRIVVAGFCFSNIMMLSFPEYFSNGNIDPLLQKTFSYIIGLLSLPVIFFAAQPFFVSAVKALRNRYVNIDAPIALATLITFSLSYIEIISGKGQGYLDSGTGIVFFMLLGRWFQEKTYDALSFDRDYLSYLPMGVTVVKDEVNETGITRHKQSIPVNKLSVGDHILILNNEIIPADATLLEGEANIDYSFVNGENEPLKIKNGEKIFAGGRQAGTAILLEVVQPPSGSYITQLWNSDAFNKSQTNTESFIHPWSRYFTAVLFTIAAAAAVYWWYSDPSKIAAAVVSVLIIACPCSLLLSATFTYGNMLRIFGRNKLYLKNASVIGRMAATKHIVFDKTGTLTLPNRSAVHFEGKPLSETEKKWIKTLALQTAHPFGKVIANKIGAIPETSIPGAFTEIADRGVMARIEGHDLRMGIASFVLPNGHEHAKFNHTAIHLSIDGQVRGFFSISNHYREGIEDCCRQLKDTGYQLHLLSGDNDGEKLKLEHILGSNAQLCFHQLPADKLQYIDSLVEKGNSVMMVGDGLNDAGALKKATVGIAVNEESGRFTPACDGILDAASLPKLQRLMRFSTSGKKIIAASFILSIAYNIVGLGYAVSASLNPMIAAILMPASSISIVIFVSLAVRLAAFGNRL